MNGRNRINQPPEQRRCQPQHDDGDILVIALAKGTERYVWLYRDRDSVLQSIGRMASNPELSLTWYDAAVLAAKVRKMEADPT